MGSLKYGALGLKIYFKYKNFFSNFMIYIFVLFRQLETFFLQKRFVIYNYKPEMVLKVVFFLFSALIVFFFV